MFQLVEDEDAYTFITVLLESTGVVFIRQFGHVSLKFKRTHFYNEK